jgi:hypothetical protein
MGEKIGKQKEYKVEKGKIVIGTSNCKICKSIFIRVETWITPEQSLFDCINMIRRRIKANMRVFGPQYFGNEYQTYLLDNEYNRTKEKDIPGKKSFIAIEMTIMPNKQFEYNNELMLSSKSFGEAIFELLETFSDNFDISNSKK